ncbi:hypothetical protein ADK77_08465 [Streptomyces antibioticus]|nr:hypothetical protein [Streptomyces antibioticus]KOG73550.1 hypothetical protein ADK77_08465 [Streptomyces antibioticus]
MDRDGVTNTTHDWPGRAKDEDELFEVPSPTVEPSAQELAALEKQLEEERGKRESTEQRAEMAKVWAVLATVVVLLLVYSACEARSGPANPDAPYCQQAGRSTECW